MNVHRRLPSLLLIMLVLACRPVGSTTPEPMAASPSPTPVPTANPTDAPPAPTSTPTPTPTPTPNAEATDRLPLPPPIAFLVLPDGSRVDGTLGSYDYDGAALDAPWLPATALEDVLLPAADAPLIISLPEPDRLVRWGARYADAADEEADVISQLAAGGDGATPLGSGSFSGPPSGSWVLAVQLFFADEQGDASYYWHVVVP
jgi:hypothetical protein